MADTVTRPGTGNIPTASPAVLTPQQNRVIWLLLAAAFVAILNETTMGVAIPHLIDDLVITALQAQWLTTAFMLTMAVVIPITGFLLRGSRRARCSSPRCRCSPSARSSPSSHPGSPCSSWRRVVQASGTAIMMPLLMTTTHDRRAAPRPRTNDGPRASSSPWRPRSDRPSRDSCSTRSAGAGSSASCSRSHSSRSSSARAGSTTSARPRMRRIDVPSVILSALRVRRNRVRPEPDRRRGQPRRWSRRGCRGSRLDGRADHLAERGRASRSDSSSGASSGCSARTTRCWTCESSARRTSRCDRTDDAPLDGVLRRDHRPAALHAAGARALAR